LTRWISVGVLLVVCAVNASAQETLLLDRDRDPALDGARRVYADLSHASLRYGSLYLLSRFELSDLAIEPDFTPDSDNDLALSIVAGLPNRAYWHPSKKFALSGDVTPSLAFVDRDGLTTQKGYALRGDAHLLLNHIYVDVYGATADELGTLPAEVGGIGTSTNRTLGADAELKYSSKTSVLVTATDSEVRYPLDRLQPDKVPVDLYDNDTRHYRATMLHKTFPRVAFSLTGDRREWEFPNTRYSDARRNHVALGATYIVRRKSFRVEAGPASMTFADPTYRTFKGVIGQLSANVPVGKRWTFQSALNRDVTFSNYENSGYYVADFATIAANWTVTRKLSFQFSPTLGRLSYDVPVNGILREDRYRQILAGWTYSTPRFRGGFDIVHYARNSNAIPGDRSGIRLILRLSLTANRWFK
jgi:hypothetical protein